MAFLSQASHLGSLLLPHDAFQEHAAHRAEWSVRLSSKGSESTFIRSGIPTFLPCVLTADSELDIAAWRTEVESTAPLDFLLRHGLWTPFGCPMSCKIRSIISATCDFTTKSDGIWASGQSLHTYIDEHLTGAAHLAHTVFPTDTSIPAPHA